MILRDMGAAMKKKMLFIYNPRAGKAKIRSNLLDIIDIFAKADYEVTAYPTQAQGDGLKAVKERKADYYDLIVCSGGDGTLDEVVTGMVQCECRLPIGYVPAGSTNDFARSLQIPKNMTDAARIIVGGKEFDCDVGKFNQDIFVYIAAFGVFTEVSYETRQDIKNVLGHMAYLLEGIRSLSAVKTYRMRVECEQLKTEGEFLYGMITNSLSVGGFKNITGKGVELDDGEFEVTLIKKPVNAAELNQLATALVNRNISNDCIYCFKTSAIRLIANEEVAWTLDGEFGGRHKDVKIENCRKAIRIIVPDKEE